MKVNFISSIVKRNFNQSMNMVSKISFNRNIQKSDSFERSVISDTISANNAPLQRKAMDKYVIGYEEEKQILRKEFVGKVKNSKPGQQDNIPSLICLYGPEISVKSDLIKGMAKEANSFLSVLDVNSDDFEHYYQQAMIDAGDRNEKTGQHTLIYIKNSPDCLSGDKKDRGNVFGLESALINQNHFSYGDKCATVVLACEDPNEIAQDINKQTDLFLPIPPAANKTLEETIRVTLDKLAPVQNMYDCDKKSMARLIDKLNPNEQGAYNVNQLKRMTTQAYEYCTCSEEPIFEYYMSEIADNTPRYIKARKIDTFNSNINKYN